MVAIFGPKKGKKRSPVIEVSRPFREGTRRGAISRKKGKALLLEKKVMKTDSDLCKCAEWERVQHNLEGGGDMRPSEPGSGRGE